MTVPALTEQQQEQSQLVKNQVDEEIQLINQLAKNLATLTDDPHPESEYWCACVSDLLNSLDDLF